VHRKGKGKGKFAPVEAYWGSGGVAPFILWPRHYMDVSDQLRAPAALLPGKQPLVSIG
jgi:hypothetical protein